jgi:predicted nucleic acid-binding protein
MGETFFVDSWFFIGVLDRYDAHHARLKRMSHRLDRARLITHEAIFHEVLAYFSEDGAQLRARAVEAVRKALANMEVLQAGTDLFLAALDRYAARPDKEYSLVDCMSMAIMEERDIRHVLTNDHHFTQAGFTIVNE